MENISLGCGHGFTYISGSFKNFGLFYLIPEVEISAIGRRAKINESLMRQYVSGKAVASEKRVKLIEDAIHELGKELQSVSFLRNII